MKNPARIQEKDFENLLKWLDEDRDKAGEEYERIRKGLINYFDFRGCTHAESLADETITRVAEKLTNLDHSRNVKKITVFYGFAEKVFKEELRNRKREDGLAKLLAWREGFGESEEDFQEPEEICLKKCLAKLNAEDREIFIRYYASEDGKKAEIRRKLAEKLNCSMNALHVRVFRLRTGLKTCVKKCLKNNL